MNGTTEAKVRQIMDVYGADRERAVFILAIKEGRSSGDDVALDADGKPVRREHSRSDTQ